MVYTTQGPRKRLEDAACALPDRLIVCDGMGGHTDGDKAAQAVLELAKTASLSEVRAGASRAVAAQAWHRSGTTCSVAHLDGPTLRWLHCGDSALWLVIKHAMDGATKVFRLTADHSLWGVIRANTGELSDRDNKHVLMSCVTGNPSTEIEWEEKSYSFDGKMERATSIWLFGTSDGFHEAFDDAAGDVDLSKLLDTFRQVVRGPEHAQRAVEECAEKTGDNATVAAMRIK